MDINVENEIEDDIVGIILFVKLLCMYTELLAKRRKRILIKRRLRLAEARPAKYCLNGYRCVIYEAVMTRNNDIIKNHLRVSWTALHQLAELIPKQHHGWNLYFVISVFLFWLACGTSYRVAAEAFTISRYTVRDIVHRMLDECVKLLPLVVKYPPSEKYVEIGHGFNLRAQTHIFTNAVGAIDGTYVNIYVPTRLRDQYVNRKMNTSIHLQAVCGSDGIFYSICTGWPGSVHDQRVLRNSQLYKDHVFPPQGFYLLGDSGYACTLSPIAIITPFKRTHSLTNAEKSFNTVHSKARSIIESSFARLKQRWRSIFQRTLELKIKNCVKVVVAACVMHNICLNDGFDSAEMYDNAEDGANDVFYDIEQADNLANDDDRALQFRNTLVQQLQQRPYEIHV